ncbi:hypothetical protein GOP47_0002817 [Adiantum capillus-veneris]|uniref:N-acyl-aliphatic-L-amino acid amidohydrolase n=1 Tax=Adiantum capillus-veneris TaxID=13818 RepID=A0A9D4VBL1_ADICA|nr:hypothetical protein GOP47_0002817 [Adiantum capillus-veneris]
MAIGAHVATLVVLMVAMAGPTVVSSEYGDGRKWVETCAGLEPAIELFRQYLRIPTVHPSPDYVPAVHFILSLAHNLSIHPARVVELVPGKGIALLTWSGSDPSLPSILLNSHMDVVPVKKEEWSHDPFEAVMEENGDIYARGAQDTKCIGIQYLEAIRNLKRKGFKPVRTVHISFVPDEEVGGGDGFAKLIDSTFFESLNVGVAIDEGLTSEAEAYRVSNADRSPWWLEIKAMGQPGHGSRLYDDSALENLMISLEAIKTFRDAQFDLVKAGLAEEGEVTSINAVYLKAGSVTSSGYVMNVQPSEAEAGLDIRVHPGTNTQVLETLIAEQWAPQSRNMSYKFIAKTPKSGRTPVDDSSPWWGLLVDAVIKTGGKLADVETRQSTTDGRLLRIAGIPTYGFSPISNTPIRQHSANEFLNAGVFCKGITKIVAGPSLIFWTLLSQGAWAVFFQVLELCTSPVRPLLAIGKLYIANLKGYHDTDL